MSNPTTARILVVDDDVSSLLLLNSILRKDGFLVTCTATLEEGLAELRTSRPDLILLDIHLPDGNGIEWCRRIKQESFAVQTPVIFISVDSDMKTKLDGFEVGGADYVTKPYVAAEVLARVRTHLRMKYAYDSLSRLQAERIARLAHAQKTIMPRPEDIPDAGFAVSMLPFHEAGGDFYDVIPIGEQIVDYVVADASGHDLDASFWTAAMKALLHEYAAEINSPADIMQSLNSSLSRIMPDGSFFTMIYARLNRRGGSLLLANAGHPPAVILRNDGLPARLEQTGDVVGAFKDAAFGLASLTLRPGDRFMMYSDGLVETEGSRESGIMNLIEVCGTYRKSSLKSMVDLVVGNIRANSIISDDIVMMGVEV
jgi:sigma-B regulation protein RsbU (phosphoserine phosphatase)